MDKTFYKYRGDNALTESIVTSGEIYLGTAHQLNDPFECSIQDIGREWVAEQVEQGMNAQLTGFLLEGRKAMDADEDFFGLRSTGIQHAINRVFAAQDVQRRYEAYRSFIKARTGHPPSDVRLLFSKLDEQLVETGIFSMSADPAQPLIWAYYGAEHRGLSVKQHHALTHSALKFQWIAMPIGVETLR